MKTAKLGALFLVSVLALAGVGAGYAMWYEDLTIDGTINTGTFDVEWSPGDCGDNEAPEKDVSSITASISGNTMTVIVTDAYPCMTYWVHFDVHCVGTVPAHFNAFVITGNPNWVSIVPELGCLPIEETQLHTGDFWYGYLEIHLDNTATQDTAYTFEIDLHAYQYNE